MIKQGVPDGNGGWKGGLYTFEDGTADETFVSFFGTNNPYAALQDISSSFRSLTTKPSLKPGKIKSFPLEATLEEVYLGTLKKVEFTRKIMAVDNSITTESVTFTIDLKAGTPDDTRFVFEKSGNTTPNFVCTKRTGRINRMERKDGLYKYPVWIRRRITAGSGPERRR